MTLTWSGRTQKTLKLYTYLTNFTKKQNVSNVFLKGKNYPFGVLVPIIKFKVMQYLVELPIVSGELCMICIMSRSCKGLIGSCKTSAVFPKTTPFIIVEGLETWD
uniref:Uncharacterized protein n=1 Tax=Cacopsylla melanoneura TaxID=428564 RepID=A0A8D8VN22_9HEMI